LCHSCNFSWIFLLWLCHMLNLFMKFFKGTQLCKGKKISFPTIQKSIKTCEYIINNGFYKLDNNFCHYLESHQQGLFLCNVFILCLWNFGIENDLCLEYLKYFKWGECDYILWCYGVFKDPKMSTFWKVHMNMKIDDILKLPLKNMFFLCYSIRLCFQNWKKNLFRIKVCHCVDIFAYVILIRASLL